jgi:biopolymer transport protein ExbD
LSLTSLIDVIFLLLLFFMLTTTFTRTGDLALSVGGAGGTTAEAPIFLRLAVDGLSVNGASIPLDQVATAIAALSPAPIVLISPQPGVTAQRLADVLTALQGLAGAQLHVLG